MCPNCILNQVGLAPGVYVAFAVCGIFFAAAVFAMVWAFKNGEFDDIESSKFEMLDDIERSPGPAHAKAAIKSNQAKSQS